MGKSTKKARMMAGVALTADVSQSYLALRTHTKTLPLHRASYLQLRSRRLQKPMHRHNSPTTRRTLHAQFGSRHEIDGVRAPSFEDNCSVIEPSFEDNCLESDVTERCSSSIRVDETITTRQACSSAATQRVQDAALLMNACTPSVRELEEFFCREEQAIQRSFMEKYNFDVVGDVAVAGRYEWVAVRP